MLQNPTALHSFSLALAARLPGVWTSQYHRHGSYGDQFPVAERLWDSGHVDWAVAEHVLGHHAVLTGPTGEELYIIERPRHRGQFLVAALEPAGFQPHHFRGVPEPNGIMVSADPVRAAAAVSRRLLPRYASAVEAVRAQARLRPDPPAHRLAPPETAKAVTLTRYGDGILGTPYTSVPAEARDALYLSGFQYVPDQGAFLLPAGHGPVSTAVRIQVLAARLAQTGVGLNLRHAPTHPGSAAAVTASPAPATQARNGTAVASAATGGPRAAHRAR
ncbi:hypothetical protein BJP40_03840 [Streptomyces sp. CC53]|uniref:hypothetical protein n=1 Tax=Streptomyces sp. CC53 TaxID=1906740 RepID=UPI0008DE0FC9|nr:hypothetical protein [Streptomyces sp. CC53]OII62144.1 hypothetical protein BJP40_03840 [Streptomyces sp. CC53]